jgi:cysteine desulfurase
LGKASVFTAQPSYQRGCIMNSPIYFDYAATTPVDPKVADKMSECLLLEGNFGNPASRSHKFGWFAEEAVDNARAQIAELIHADPREIIFTSGATESDNLAIKGYAFANTSKGKHIITMSTEHKAVLDSCAFMESKGFEVTYLTPETDGILDLDVFTNAIREDTLLVSIMHVNNETGVMQDIKAIGEICAEHNITFHVDAAQSAGKIDIDLSRLHVDMMSFSAHKIYGPKGIGALFVRRRSGIVVEPLIHGGGHEKGMRSGTLATHLIVGMGEAFSTANALGRDERQRIWSYYKKLWSSLCSLPRVKLNGHESNRIGGILNIQFCDIEGESMMMAMSDIAISSGSACTSFSIEPSYVLKAMGLSNEQAHSSLRFSIGRYTTDQDMAHLTEVILRSAKALSS